MRVCIVPTYQGADQGDGGIRRVVEAQQRYLPELGVHVTDTPGDADLIACHGTSLVEQAGVPLIAHNHGLMWREYEFGAWGDDVNKHCIELMARAQAVTAPSKWVANAIARGMLIRPEVVYHGVDAAEWAHSYDHLGYVLWNKARADQVSDPDDMNRLASLLPHIPFVSTFGESAQNVILTGPRSYTDMRPIVQKAGVYLATARETFGIGTLEALAAGVPIAGWRYGGQEEIIVEGETGYLAEWGDYEGLAQAVQRCLADRARLARNAVDDARARWAWPDKITQYAALYQAVLARWTAPRPRVSVVVTTHNLAHYLGDAIKSVVSQTMTDWECLVIDDDSTDHPADVVQRFVDGTPLRGKIRYFKTPSNLKLSGARNYGWQHATGKYIIFLDADDMLAPNALDILSTALENEAGTHIAYGHLDTVDDRGQHQQRNPWPPDKYDWRQQLAHLNQLPYAALLRREVLERSGGYRTRDWRAEDAALWCRLTSFGFRAAKVTDDATLIYRLRGDSKSRGEPGDGDWTAWYPWRLAASGPEGLQAIQEKKQPNPALVPFGAQGTPPLPLRAWPVPHHQHPAVSVIIPVGPGHAKYLIDALDSVQAQTMPAWECIVVCDAKDHQDQLEPRLASHPWARVYWAKGRGAGAARNIGLMEARAPLVVFLDADDMLTPRALEQMLRAYVGNQGGYVYSDWASLEDETRWDGEADWHHTPEYSEDLWFQGFQHPVTCLIETEHARAVGFDEELPAWEDWDFYLKLLVKGVCPAKVAEPLLIYRLTSGTRRKAAQANEERLLSAIRDRYAPYITGLEQLMPCCGGNTAALNAARTALDDMLGPLAEELAFAAPPIEPGVVRMEFIGDSQGAQTWFSKDRQRRYEGGRDPRARFIDAAPQDVEHLLSLGVWRVVQLPKEEPERELELVEAVAEPRTRRGRRG